MQSIEQILKSLHADAVELQKIKAESLTISTFNLGEARYRLDLAETLITLISESGLDTRLLQRAKNLVDLNIASLDVNEQARYGNAPEKSSLATVESQKKIYYHRKALYEARENLDGSVNVWPQGGGFEKNYSAETFAGLFTAVEIEPPFRKIAVSAEFINDGKVEIPCYSNGLRWNGWAMPYFDMISALEVVKLMPHLTYDEANDMFVWKPNDGVADDTEEYRGCAICVEGKVLTVYPIGSGSWCWE
jgi:hypothetical protein